VQRRAGRGALSRRNSHAAFRRRRLLVLLAAVGLAPVLVVRLDNAEPAGSALRHKAGAGVPVAAGSPITTAPTTTPPTMITTTTTIGTGDLPQTAAFPSSNSPEFLAEMAALWDAVVSGSPERGLPAFFPEAAYKQVKAERDPAADWESRLLGGYDLDIGAAHTLLGPGAASAQLIGVRVYATTAHWVVPGRCYNKVGYFEVPNSRVIYQVDGQVRSFGIASMISWRGDWYVIHLGAVIEAPGVATVDAPAAGAGYPASLYTC
jgi:hypothetical protein